VGELVEWFSKRRCGLLIHPARNVPVARGPDDSFAEATSGKAQAEFGGTAVVVIACVRRRTDTVAIDGNSYGRIVASAVDLAVLITVDRYEYGVVTR
jgi:hypothetical protein